MASDASREDPAHGVSMLIRLTPVEGRHDILVNPEDISECFKTGECGCYTLCYCSLPTTVVMRSGKEHIVEESLNTIEARTNKD